MHIAQTAIAALSASPAWADALFALGLSLLLAHELDAMRAREWRLLPVLRRLSDERGRDGFILLHVPLVAVLVWLAAHPSPGVRSGFQAAADVFFVVHVALHRAFVRHPDYDFHGPISRGLILGAGAVGAVHLALLAATA